jgi:hypothetical protein
MHDLIIKVKGETLEKSTSVPENTTPVANVIKPVTAVRYDFS